MMTGGPMETDFAMAELARQKAQEERSRKTACWSDVHFLEERVEELENRVFELERQLKQILPDIK